MLRKLEKYELIDEIGHGGMATVYRARDSSLDRLVALKVLHPHLQRTGEARARFSREAKSVARLHHPHILEIYDYSGESSDETYIAAELLTGPTLKEFIEADGEVPAEVASCIALQVAEALSEAHQKGIIHRDVKPENVLIHLDECVKLTDFGIAHMVDTQAFTVTGQILGSPGHMAPEQVEGRECDARSDVFSLGTVLYYCAVGRLPFVGRNPHHLLKQLLEGDYPDPLRARPAIGSEFAAILAKALQREPDERYQNAAAFADALRAFLLEMGIEQADELLAAYLQNPETVRQQVRANAIERSLSIGAQAVKQRDIPKAQAALSRVLALDDGNEKALRLLASLGRHRRRKLAASLGAVLAVLGVLSLGYATWLHRSALVIDETAPAPTTSLSKPSGERAQGSDSALVATELEPETAPETDADEPVAQAVEDRPPGNEPPPGPRLVVFKPSPSNVSISIDGAALRPYGPGFQGARLKPGRHTFSVVGGEDCCEPWTKRVTIPPGRGDYDLPINLRYKPAKLYLRGPAPRNASVEITLPGNRVIKGKIREILTVPMRTLTAQAQVSIEAPGYRLHQDKVTLRAGAGVTEHTFTLERLDETP
jgi:serine/threonine protein kinase